ncbi:hypothetical protein [Spiroplasma endosymbiont of Danaus chrysippus]|uniref:hypothetical protein n=1 Tax=Spiroplasma endosymbiont of Danaus chrysippus TaxID=2691041 RepID=UPI00157B6392|nr:hypothetical protein [Spiroplasma endosymbiont of Danaus chrysippus]
MPAGLTALLNMIGGIGQKLLESFSYVFDWVFAGDSIMTNWPRLFSNLCFFVLQSTSSD